MIINRDELRDRIYACFLGKNIGGTLGMPFENEPGMPPNVTFYTQDISEPTPNDDLDLQLVWLNAIKDRGPKGLSNRVLGEYWLNFIPPHWNEYGICKANMKAGLVPPLSGEYHNSVWKHSNGAWIRSEIWACMAPGCPDIAIQYAYEDASVDHGGGEGTNAALFTAAVESAAFVVSDRDELIRIGLSKMPPDCRVARAIKVALESYKQGKTWQEARAAVVADSEDVGPYNAAMNLGFITIGWMYGEGDFGKSICTAVNCGDDTDCTAATLGAIFGIILGKGGIPKEWAEPIGDKLVTSSIDRCSADFPRTLTELTEDVMWQVPHMLAAHKANVDVSPGKTDLTGIDVSALSDQAIAKVIWNRSPYAVSYDLVHTRVTLDYGREPDIVVGEPFTLKITLESLLPDSRHIELRWHLPDGWEITSSTPSHFTLHNWPGIAEFYKPVETAVEITPDAIYESTSRGILEVIAPGRPTVGLVPLLFFEGTEQA